MGFNSAFKGLKYVYSSCILGSLFFVYNMNSSAGTVSLSHCFLFVYNMNSSAGTVSLSHCFLFVYNMNSSAGTVSLSHCFLFVYNMNSSAGTVSLSHCFLFVYNMISSAGTVPLSHCFFHIVLATVEACILSRDGRFLGSFAKLRTATIGFLMSVCPSVRM